MNWDKNGVKVVRLYTLLYEYKRQAKTRIFFDHQGNADSAINIGVRLLMRTKMPLSMLLLY